MKKLLLTLIIPFFVISSAHAAKGVITIIQSMKSTAISASGTYTSPSVDLSKFQVKGHFSIQVKVTGSGTCKFEYLLSNDGSNFLEPSTASDIVTGFTATSGPGSDGKYIYVFYPEPARYLKIKCTETGGANSVTATVHLFIQ